MQSGGQVVDSTLIGWAERFWRLHFSFVALYWLRKLSGWIRAGWSWTRLGVSAEMAKG